MKKLVITLTILGIISALLLAFVYQWTAPMIKQHQEDDKKAALKIVTPDSDTFKEVVKNGTTYYEGNVDGEVAVIATGPGFQGSVTLMIGANPAKGIIYRIKILDQAETPGLGAYITGDKYKGNYVNKPFGEYKVVKHPVPDPSNSMEVEAITGATISSTKVKNIIQKAVDKMKLDYGGGA